MSRFVQRGYKVLYVEPSFSMIRRQHEDLPAVNRYLCPNLRRRGDNLYILAPPRALPKWTHPRVARLNYRWFAGMAKWAARRLGMEPFVLWVYDPKYFHALDILDPAMTVFDLVDDLVAYEQAAPHKAKHVAKCIEGFLSSSDLVIVTAQTLYDKYGCLATGRIELVPNGFDSSLFSGCRDITVPGGLRDLKRPIVGFVGVLFDFLDYELLEYVINDHRDKTFVFVGRTESPVEGRVRRLSKLSNVRFLGHVPKEQVPSYIRCFDVCLNPFRVDEVARSAIPLKVFEYLACGKPVVSTRMASLEREAIASVIYFADDAPHFSRLILHAIKEDSPHAAEERRVLVEAYTWDRLFAKVHQAFLEVAKTRLSSLGRESARRS